MTEEKKSAPAEATAEKEEKINVPEKFKSLVKEIETLSVLDLAELVKVLEKKFGVSAAPQIIAAQPTAAGSAESSGASEKSIFTIELKEVGVKKIEVIKAIRDITQKGLKEAKDLVDAAEKAAQVVKENVKKEEAEEIKKKLETAGAKVELK
ncbi:MAG: 50S ribosomal protein L7/L12 [Candidatus Nealsonbacteria bacterium]|nr:50S ribosomal protein L7/L12 [Candidatus Nealsonbacteria bacterium]